MQKLVIAVLLFFIIVVAAFNIIARSCSSCFPRCARSRFSLPWGARRTLLRVFLAAGTFVALPNRPRDPVWPGHLRPGRALRLSLGSKVYLIARLPVQISVREILLWRPAPSSSVSCHPLPGRARARLRVVDGLRYL